MNCSREVLVWLKDIKRTEGFVFLPDVLVLFYIYFLKNDDGKPFSMKFRTINFLQLMQNVLFWFRNDLRLHDNEALTYAAGLGRVIPVYIIDERQFARTSLGFLRTGYFRAKFLLESLEDLKRSLKNAGSDLIVRKGIPEDILAALAVEFEVSHVVASKEVTQEETSVESALTQKLKPFNVDIDLIWGSTLYHARDLPFQIHYIPDVFTDFRKRIASTARVRALFPDVTSLGSMEGIEAGEVPDLKSLGYELREEDPRAAMEFRGGETEGLKRLDYYLWQSHHVENYKHTRNDMMGPDYSSRFSAWLSLGCLSPRKVYWELQRYEQEVLANESTYWLVFELLWRDYFHFIALKFGIRLFKRSGIKHDLIRKWKRNKDFFKKWMDGYTGVPIVDACMRELKHTGYLSNRGRQIVASFFTKDLGLEWWWGAVYFESQLIDYEVCSNWGNWNYIAGIGTDPREDRYFNPVIQSKKYDSDCRFIRTWLPELEALPDDSIHHYMAAGEQDKALATGDYPLTPLIKSKRWSS